jgi:hypothetical protein
MQQKCIMFILACIMQKNIINQEEWHVATKRLKNLLYHRLVLYQGYLRVSLLYRAIQVNIAVNSLQPNLTSKAGQS